MYFSHLFSQGRVSSFRLRIAVKQQTLKVHLPTFYFVNVTSDQFLKYSNKFTQKINFKSVKINTAEKQQINKHLFTIVVRESENYIFHRMLYNTGLTFVHFIQTSDHHAFLVVSTCIHLCTSFEY